MSGYNADRYVSNNGPRGNGCSYEYDSQTGKYGVRYADNKFYPDPDEKQPGYCPPQEDSSIPDAASVPTGPSDYDKLVDGFFNEFGRAATSSAKDMAKTASLIAGVAKTIAFISSTDKKTDKPGSAAANTRINPGPTVKNTGNTKSAAADTGSALVDQIVTIRTSKVPKIAYVGIELLVIALLTMPILNFIDGFTTGLANQDLADGTVIILGAAMLAGSIIIAAAIGLIVCRLVKAVTAK